MGDRSMKGLLRARPALGWVLLFAIVALQLIGQGAPGGLGAGVAVAACFYPNRPDEPLIY